MLVMFIPVAHPVHTGWDRQVPIGILAVAGPFVGAERMLIGQLLDLLVAARTVDHRTHRGVLCFQVAAHVRILRLEGKEVNPSRRPRT